MDEPDFSAAGVTILASLVQIAEFLVYATPAQVTPELVRRFFEVNVEEG